MATVTDETDNSNTITDCEDYSRGPLGLGAALCIGLLLAALVLAACGCMWVKWILEAL